MIQYLLMLNLCIIAVFPGYCRETNVRASIEIVGTQQVIFDVDSKDLVPLEEFTVDVAVCLGIKYVVTDQIPEISQKLGKLNKTLFLFFVKFLAKTSLPICLFKLFLHSTYEYLIHHCNCKCTKLPLLSPH